MFKTFVLPRRHPGVFVFKTRTALQEIWTLPFLKKKMRQQLDFWVAYLDSYLIKAVRMHPTDHLGFRYKYVFICKCPLTSTFLGRTNFSSDYCEHQ